VAYTHLTFRQLDIESDCLARGLDEAGVSRGVRTISDGQTQPGFFCPRLCPVQGGGRARGGGSGHGRFPDVELPQGKPGPGPDRHPTGPRAANPGALLFQKCQHLHHRRQTLVLGWAHPAPVAQQDAGNLTAWPTHRADEIAAILFTTGSTGPAKGVRYTHGVFDAQVRNIRAQFGITPDEIDLPTFPLFALFDPALGMTAIIPGHGPHQAGPGQSGKIIEAIVNHGVTNMFASPALLNRVGRYGKEKGIRLPTLKRVISAGAPATPANIEQFCAMLTDNAQIHTGYGATEAMPVSSFGSGEILSETRTLSEQGYGMCVGKPIAGIDVRIIRITDGPISRGPMTWNARRRDRGNRRSR
jgi:non-ribosomal peptide synthetase component F